MFLWISMPAISSRQDENKLPQKSVLFRCNFRYKRKQFIGQKVPAANTACSAQKPTLTHFPQPGTPRGIILPWHFLPSALQPHEPCMLLINQKLTSLIRTRCSWVSQELSHAGTAGSALIRHEQASFSPLQPFIHLDQLVHSDTLKLSAGYLPCFGVKNKVVLMS